MTALVPVDLTRRLLGPVFAMRDDPASLQRMLGRIGIHAPTTAAEIEALDWVSDLVSVAEETGVILRRLAAGTADAQTAASALEQLERMVSIIDGLGGAPQPGGFFDAEVMAEIAAELPGLIVTDALKEWSPPVVAALRLLGVWESELVIPSAGAPAWRRPVRRDRLRLDQLSEALDPAARLRDRWGWGPGPVDADGIVRDLIDVVRLFGFLARYTAVPDIAAGLVPAARRWERRAAALPLVSAVVEGGRRFVEIGAVVSPIEGAAGDEGVFVGITSDYPPAGPMPLTGDWLIELSAAVPAGVAIRPDRVDIVGNAAEAVQLTVTSTRPRTMALPLATLDVPGWRLVVNVGAATDPSFEIRLTSATAEPARLSFDPSGGLAFLRELVGGPLDLGVDVDLSWSTDRGFRVGAAAGLELVIPLSLQLGPIEIQQLRFVLGVDTDGVRASASIDTSATLGPFQATVHDVGAALDVNLSDGPLPAFAMDLLPPAAVGLSITTEAVKGGGFLQVQDGRYSGALSLDIVDVGIDAIVVVDTSLPGDPDGFALFATLTARFPGIPLGFGFTLNGVGGLLALNRALDAEAMAAGLRSGVIDSLLFPDDPLGDVAQLVAQIDEYFPLLDGNTVVGPILLIGWGSPTLITAQLGVVISLPDGIIAVMGSIEALLPTPDAPLLTLHMDALGVVDLGAGTFTLTASLYDSRLLETIDLSGDMAMFLQATARPYFLLSVGGFHPGFEPPSVVPASMHDLRRMQAAIRVAANVSVSIKAYFALTSNSVQFGASVDVEASVEIWPTTYTAMGWFGFDVLLVFSPFKIVASMSAGVGIYAGGKELMGVQLGFLLEGPKPWFASGYASFKFFGIKVAFELEVGGKAAGEPKPIAHPRAAVIAALRSPSSWSEVAPADGLTAGITYASAQTDGDDAVWVRPDHQVAARQAVAPLDRRLEILGQAVPAPGEDLMTVTGAGISGSTLDIEWQLATDWFAPAQFEELGRTEKLTRASFEEMTAGVTFGAPAVAITADPDALGTSVTLDYEEGTLADSVRTGAAGVGLRHHAALSAAPLFEIAPTSYTVVGTVDGRVAAGLFDDLGLDTHGVSQHEAVSARNRAIAGDDALAAELVVVPVASAMEPRS